MNSEKLKYMFTYHAPKKDQPARYQTIREACFELAKTLNDLCPDSEEKDIAIEKLSECSMWANASIARNE